MIWVFLGVTLWLCLSLPLGLLFGAAMRPRRREPLPPRPWPESGRARLPLSGVSDLSGRRAG